MARDFLGLELRGFKVRGLSVSDPATCRLQVYLIAAPGDWIVTGVEGERYPVKNEVFKKTYERAD